MTWTPPSDPNQAAAALRAFREAGIEAARVPYGVEEPVLRAASALGVALYMDLPVANLSAAALMDTLAFAERALARVVALAAVHPSLRGVGLAASVNTSSPAACGYFEQLAPAARAAGLQTYYLTRFIESDRCAGRVDAVLLDARTRRPGPLLDRWRAHQDTPAGIGAFGVRVSDGVSGGHLTERSPAAQARALEDGLRDLLQRPDPPVAVFVHTWQGDPYGLLDREGGARPAFGVVRGFYTGRQTVFAVDAGPPPPSPPGASGLILMGWVVLVLLALLMGAAPRFRLVVPRYFARHGYYREAVQRGGGVEGFAAVGLAVALALAAGVVVGVLLDALAHTDVIEVGTGSLPPERQALVLDALQRPVLTVLVGAALYGLWLLINMVWLFALTGRRHRIRPQQALILSTFSRWPVFALMLAALLAAQAGASLDWMPWLVWAWIAIELIAAARMLYDYARITRVPMEKATLVGLGAPLGVALVIVVAVSLLGGPELAFLYHLATRT